MAVKTNRETEREPTLSKGEGPEGFRKGKKGMQHVEISLQQSPNVFLDRFMENLSNP